MFLGTALTVLSASAAFAQTVGERIVVTADAAQLKSQNDIVGTVPKGSILTVKDVNGDWFRVIYSDEKSTIKGWIKRTNAVPLQKALDIFNDELRRQSTAELHAIRGAIWHELHEYDNAIADFDEAVRINPQQSTTIRRRGNSWFGKRDYDKAIADYTTAIRVNPNSAWAYSNRGLAWHKKNEYDRAIADHTEAIHLDPVSSRDFQGRGDAWFGKGEYDKAIADLTAAIRLDPNEPNAYFNRGLAWHKKNEYDKAVADFTASIQFDPKITEFYYSRARTYCRIGEYDKAIADCNDAIRRDPNYARAYMARGVSWRMKEKFDRAVADLKMAIQLDPTEMHSHAALAWIRVRCSNDKYRDIKQGVELARKACELSGWRDPYSVRILAAAYAESGDFKNAVKWQEKSLELSSEAEKKQWGFLLELYKSGKTFPADRLEFWLGGRDRYAAAPIG